MKKKVVFVNRFFYPDHSATSQILSDLAFDLAENGFDVTVVASRLGYDGVGEVLPSRQTVRGVKICRVWSSRFGRGSLVGRASDYVTFYLSSMITLWRTVQPGTVVVAKTDPPLISVVALPIVRMRRAKLVNWLQDLFPEVASALGVGLAQGLVGRALRRLRNVTLKSAVANIVLGERMRERVITEGGYPERVQTIANWADGSAIQPIQPAGNPVRKEWGLDGRVVVGYSGNLGRAHEFETILATAEALRDRDDVVFLFIGGGAQRKAVEQAARERRLSNVLFKPYQPRERLAESLSAADIHLVSLNPALEGLIVPSKFYGIAAAGRPTLFIGDAEGEIPRVLRESDCGFAISSGDDEALTARVCELAAAPVMRERLGANARALLLERYDRSVALAHWHDVLNAVADQ